MLTLSALTEIRGDIRIAIRHVKRAPALAAVAMFTLTLHIGATTALFALADGTRLRPLPFTFADRLVMRREQRSDGSLIRASIQDDLCWCW